MPAKPVRKMTLVRIAHSQRSLSHTGAGHEQLSRTLYPNAFEISMRR
jgi:hypothetical protein